MQNIQIQKTEDGSQTLYSEKYKEHYHSIFGAKNESQHIFIEAGLKIIDKPEISIFEMGFGTGLNALLSANEAIKSKLTIKYFCIEKHPVLESIYKNLDYVSEQKSLFKKLHEAEWNKLEEILPNFHLFKHKGDILDYIHQNKYDLVYYDAFSPDIQPDLWSKDIFKSIYNQMNKGGILMTYSVKGVVKRALKSVGFAIEKIPGPKGKREILRAVK